MKNLLPLLLLLFTLASHAQSNDKIDTQCQVKLQSIVDQLTESEYLDLEKETLDPQNVLDTREKAEQFAKGIILMKYPNQKESIDTNFKISEDKSRKIWFTSINLDNGQTDTAIKLMFLKNNCKIIWYSNFP